MASNVVYYTVLVDPLIETLRFFVKREVVFLMAHMRQWERTDKKFFGKTWKVTPRLCLPACLFFFVLPCCCGYLPSFVA
jgi:hypothetical protein